MAEDTGHHSKSERQRNLSDFLGMIIGARQTGLIISITADLLEFSHPTVFRVHSEYGAKKKEETV